MKNSGLFLHMAKWCFFGLFFYGFNGFVVCFCVSGIVAKVLKMLVSNVLGFCGVAYSCLFWVWKV